MWKKAQVSKGTRIQFFYLEILRGGKKKHHFDAVDFVEDEMMCRIYSFPCKTGGINRNRLVNLQFNSQGFELKKGQVDNLTSP